MKNSILTNLLLAAICIMVESCSTNNNSGIKNPVSHELYRIQVGGKCGFINEYGKLVIEPQFDRAYWYFTDSVCFVTVGERHGLINTDGDFVDSDGIMTLDFYSYKSKVNNILLN